jgi:uncharacterized protein (TIGR00369 family)
MDVMQTDRTPAPKKKPKKAQAMLETLGYVDTVEIDRERGFAAVVFEAEERHLNADDVVQGGITTGWLDVAMASAVFVKRGSGTSVASLEIKTAYMGRISSGIRYRVEGWIERLGNRTAFLEGQVLSPGNLYGLG